MNTIEQGPTFIFYSVFLLLAVSIVTFRWGKRTPGGGNLLVCVGLLALLTGAGLDSGVLLQETFRVKSWLVGWILPKNDPGALRVGVFHDPLSITMNTLVTIIVGTFLVNKDILGREPHPNRSYAALAISTAGVVLAWCSITPWLSFSGIMLTIVGGFVSLSSRWDSNREANVAAKFVWERSLGLLLAFFGACILSTTQSALVLNHIEQWATLDHSVPTLIGSTLLVLGLFVQMQPFPLVGWLVTSSEVSLPLKLLLNQILPAWAAFSLLIRFEPYLVKIGLFPDFGWVALCSSILILCLGLFQSQWRLGLGAWLAGAFSLSCAFVAFSGPLTGMAFFLGVSLGALGLSCGSVAFDKKTHETLSSRSRGNWTKIALFLAASAGTGVIGFVSATGGIHWIAGATSLPGVLTLFLFVYFSFALLGWRLLWQVIQKQKAVDISWLTLFSIFLWIMLSMGLVWTGTITGETLYGNPDRVATSLFHEFFGPTAGEVGTPTDFLSASSFYWGALILAFLAAYWTAGRGEDKWRKFLESFPKTNQFIEHGYGIDAVSRKMERGLVWLGHFSETTVDLKIWSNWIPTGLHYGLRALSKAVSEFDLKLTSIIEEGLRKWVEIPGKTLQLIQTGDVRWYLFFALGSGFALLFHFLPNL